MGGVCGSLGVCGAQSGVGGGVWEGCVVAWGCVEYSLGWVVGYGILECHCSSTECYSNVFVVAVTNQAYHEGREEE